MSNENKTIVDGKHYFFQCSKCKAPLMDAWVNYEDDDIVWEMLVECCHCGDKSYKQTIKGMFYIGQTEESEKYTAIDSLELEKSPIIVKTKKVKQYVK